MGGDQCDRTVGEWSEQRCVFGTFLEHVLGPCVRNVPVECRPGELGMYVSQVLLPPHDLIKGITIRPKLLSIMEYLDYIILWINMDCVFLYPDRSYALWRAVGSAERLCALRGMATRVWE